MSYTGKFRNRLHDGTTPDRSSRRAAVRAIDIEQAASLRKAADLIETSAFELASNHPGALIGELIIMAADLTRIAEALRGEADEDPA